MGKLNYDIFPRLALYLSHEVRVTDRKVWKALEDEVRENLHFMSFDEQCQLLYSFSEMRSNGVSVNLKHTIQEKVLAQLPQVNASSFMLALQAMRFRDCD